MSNELDLNQILYQNNLRSKPVRQNFSNIETEFNALKTEFDAQATFTTFSEVVQARESRSSLKANLTNIRREIAPDGAYAVGLRVSEQDTPDMTVKILTGNGFVSGEGVVLNTAVDSATIGTAVSGKHRIDAVVINNSSNTSIKTGGEVSTATAPEIPSISTGEMLLAHFEVTNTMTQIDQDEIVDDRNILSVQSNRGINITNQTQFEWFFGDGTETGVGTTNGGWSYATTGAVIQVQIPENTSINLFPCQNGGTTTTFNSNRAYQLKTQIKLNNNISILGNNVNKCLIAKDDTSAFEDDIRFLTEAGNTSLVTGTSGANFLVNTGSNFSTGDMINYNTAFYNIVSVATNTLGVDRSTGTTATGSNITKMTKGMKFDNFSFDGRGGLNGLGGSIDGVGKNGGAFDLSYCGDSEFTLQTINHKVDGFGGAFYSTVGKSSNIKVSNISDCYSTTGIIYGLYDSKISDGFRNACNGTTPIIDNCSRSEITGRWLNNDNPIKDGTVSGLFKYTDDNVVKKNWLAEPTLTLQLSSPTEADMFTHLEPYLPVVGDKVSISGGLVSDESTGGSSTLRWYSWADRLSTTQIRFHYLQMQYSIDGSDFIKGGSTSSSSDIATKGSGAGFGKSGAEVQIVI
jgi:hypothetical protein